MANKQLTADSWTDVLGQTYKPGDIVAVATISGRSPHMQFAEVFSINTTNPAGEPYYKHGNGPAVAGDYHSYYSNSVEPTATVTIVAFGSSRGFSGYDNSQRRKSTIQIIENVIALPGVKVSDLVREETND